MLGGTKINAYLLDAPTAIVEPVAAPLSKDVLPMIVGSCPTDGGNLIVEADEYDDFIQREPLAKQFIHPYIGSEEFINGKQRYCLWLKNCSPSTLHKMPLVMQRIKAVREFRLACPKSDYRFSATTVYNTFPWCRPTAKQKATIEVTAQKILDVRADFADSSLADLYNELAMPKILRDAHRENDKAVMTAYGFSSSMFESEIVAALMTLYQKFF